MTNRGYRGTQSTIVIDSDYQPKVTITGFHLNEEAFTKGRIAFFNGDQVLVEPNFPQLKLIQRRRRALRDKEYDYADFIATQFFVGGYKLVDYYFTERYNEPDQYPYETELYKITQPSNPYSDDGWAAKEWQRGVNSCYQHKKGIY